MSNLDAVYKGLTEGHDVYIIDDVFTDCAVHYSPKLGGERVKIKGSRLRGGVEIVVPHSDKTAFDATLGGEVVTKEEYDNY